jgi:hypothetical protein
MSRKNQSIVSTEVFINGGQSSEQEHHFEHVHFLEERTNKLEERVQILGDIFTSLMDLDEDEEDDEEEDDEDEYEDEDEEADELRHLIANCCCVWGHHEKEA